MIKTHLKNSLKLLAAFCAITSLAACGDTQVETTPEVQVEAATPILSNEHLQKDIDQGLFQSHLEARLAAEAGVGVAIGIVQGDQNSFLTLGRADIANGKTIDKDSLFEIGSITKTFTTIVLADMVIKGEVGLDDPVSKYLPASVKMPEYQGQKITLKDLATHTSALPRMPGNFNPADPLNPFADYTPELMYEFLSGYSVSRPIGKEVAYSNLGMGLLGHVLALQEGKPYEQLVTDRILQPLGMTNTFMTIPGDKIDNFAIGHDAAGEATPHWDIATLSGAGALRSDIADMTIYMKANMGLIQTPLKDAMEMSHKLQKNMGDDGSHIGLGWFTQIMDVQTVTWHNGATGGFKTFLGFDKVHKRGVIVMENAQGQPELIGRAILTNKPEMLEPAVEDESLKFTADQLERFVGKYQLAPTFIISITRKNDKLFLQATNQPKFPIFAKSEMEFFLKVVEASVIFKENDQGKIVSLVLNQNGMMQPAQKL